MSWLQMDEENAAASTAGHKLEAPFVNGPSLVEVDGAIDDFHDTGSDLPSKYETCILFMLYKSQGSKT